MAKRQKTLLTLFSLFLLVNFFTNVLADDVNYKDGKAQTEIKELSGSYTLKFDKKIDEGAIIEVEGKEPEHIYYDGAQMVNFQIQNSTHGNFNST